MACGYKSMGSVAPIVEEHLKCACMQASHEGIHTPRGGKGQWGVPDLRQGLPRRLRTYGTARYLMRRVREYEVDVEALQASRRLERPRHAYNFSTSTSATRAARSTPGVSEEGSPITLPRTSRSTARDHILGLTVSTRTQASTVQAYGLRTAAPP